MIGSEEVIFVGIDVGTTKVCALVGQLDEESRLRVIGVGIVPSLGMKKGGVVNLEGVARAVEAAKDKAERTSGYEITSALVSLSGAQIASLNSKGMAGVSGRIIGAGVARDSSWASPRSRPVPIASTTEASRPAPRSAFIASRSSTGKPRGRSKRSCGRGTSPTSIAFRSARTTKTSSSPVARGRATVRAFAQSPGRPSTSRSCTSA